MITVINFVGGLAIGVLMNGMDAAAALQTYSILTIGDGLTSQIPSLMISLATGVLVTKGSKEADISGILQKQTVFHTEGIVDRRVCPDWSWSIYSDEYYYIFRVWNIIYRDSTDYEKRTGNGRNGCAGG